MVSGRRYLYGLVSAAVVLSGVLAGCGGSGSVKGIAPTVRTTGGVGSDTGTATAGTTAGGTPQQVQVTVSDGSTQTATLPPFSTVPSSGVVGVVQPGPILEGLTHPSFHGVVKTPKATVKSFAETPYHVYVNDFDSGVTVDTGGSLTGFLILCPAESGPKSYKISVTGPFTLVNGATSSLTIGRFVFRVVVYPDGSVTVPNRISGNLPGDGGSFDGGNSVTVRYPTRVIPHMVGGSASLRITYGSNAMFDADLVGSTGTVTYKNNQAINHGNIPDTGVDSVEFSFVTQ